MRNKSALLGGAALGVLFAMAVGATADAKTAKHHHHAHADAASSDLAAKVESLTAAVGDLEARLNEETQARAQLTAQAQAAQAAADSARADAAAAHQELAEQIQTIPGQVQGEINTEIAAAKPKTDKIYYKGITLTLGGFLESAGIYRSKSLESDMASSYAKIPYGNAPLAHVGEARASARQSRVSFLAQGDINPTTHAAFYGEFDFLGAAQTANSNESNSYTPRIRNIYGTMDWDDWGLHMLAGQNWSLVTLNSKGISPRNEVPPTVIDAQYVPGFAWARQPQVRLVKDFNKELWVAVSIENPQSTYTGTGGAALPTGISAILQGSGNATINPAPVASAASSGFDVVNALSLNHVPDVVGKVAYEPNIGGAHPVHIEAFGLYRDFYDRINVASGNALGLPVGVHNKDISGGGFGGSVTATVIPKLVDLQISAMTGEGIGRYGSAQLSDATLKPNGEIAPIHETMFLGGATVHATPQLDIYVFGGDERENAKYSTFGGKFYGFGPPPTFSASVNCDIDGGTCSATTREVEQIAAGFWDKAYTGAFGQIRVGVQYSHTWLTAIPYSNGFAPKTSDDMIFTSFRYYPF